MIRTLVVEDHTIVRDALVAFLRRAPDIEVVAMASGIRDALPLLDQHNPDVVVVDLFLDDGNGTEIARALRRDHGKGLVVILTGATDAFAAAQAFAAGARGYVLKSHSSQDLLDAIRTVVAGELYVAREIAAQLSTPEMTSQEPTADSRRRLEALSPREHEIFRQVVAGYASKEIAHRLCISAKTVETHRTNINRKLAVRTAADVIRFAFALGIPVAPRKAENSVLS